MCKDNFASIKTSPLQPVLLAVVLMMAMVPVSVLSKEAAPMSDSPLTDKRVNDISSELRCLVCQNQTIEDSHAELAIDLKNQVREMVDEGRSDTEIMNYMVERYGDFVLYRPPVKAVTIFLWAGPFLLLFVGLVVLIFTLRKRNSVLRDDVPMSEEDNKRIQSALAGKHEGGEKQL